VESSKQDRRIDALEEFIGVASAMAGGLVGGTIGLVAAGPAGALAGGPAGTAVAFSLRKVATELRQRFLSPRERVRIGTVFSYAIEKIERNLAGGLEIRDDGFFPEETLIRTPADEIYEGVLIAAQREYEEKKLKFYGNLVANIPFQKTVDRGRANFLIRIAERLSYRQLCLLYILLAKNEYALRQNDYVAGGLGIGAEPLVNLLQEMYELSQLGLVYLRSTGTPAVQASIPGVESIAPGRMFVMGGGATLANLMELWDLDPSDLADIARYMRN
jgi:hypothetical protein